MSAGIGWTRPGTFDAVAKGWCVSGFPKRLRCLRPVRTIVLASQIPKHRRSGRLVGKRWQYLSSASHHEQRGRDDRDSHFEHRPRHGDGFGDIRRRGWKCLHPVRRYDGSEAAHYVSIERRRRQRFCAANDLVAGCPASGRRRNGQDRSCLSTINSSPASTPATIREIRR